MASQASVHHTVVRLAAAIARAHPECAEDVEGDLGQGSLRVIENWASAIPDDATLMVDSYSSYSLDSNRQISLHAQERPMATLEAAFNRANRIKDGLGWQLIKALQDITYGFGLTITPNSLFEMTSHHEWFGETTQKGYFEQWLDMNGDEHETLSQEEIEDLGGPEKFLQQFNHVPSNVFEYRKVLPKKEKPLSAQRYIELAGKANSDWECSLMLALAAMRDFKDASYPTIFDLMSSSNDEYEQGAYVFMIGWNQSDNTDYWLDELMQNIWNVGLAGEAQFSYEVSADGSEHSAGLDVLVKTTEALLAHMSVMDQFMEVLREAEDLEKNAAQS